MKLFAALRADICTGGHRRADPFMAARAPAFFSFRQTAFLREISCYPRKGIGLVLGGLSCAVCFSFEGKLPGKPHFISPFRVAGGVRTHQNLPLHIPLYRQLRISCLTHPGGTKRVVLVPGGTKILV